MEQSIKNILSAIDDAIVSFQDTVPGIQKLILEELQPVIKEFDIKDGRILNNLKNLKLIGTLKNKLEKIIISADYKKSVEKFIDSFNGVSNLNNQYFSQWNKEFKPKNTLPIIKQLAVESTINNLVGQGMSSSVIDPIKSILNQNITTGGNYAQFQEQLRNHILTNDTGEGSLERYTKQITTDAIHQFSRQYHQTIAQDLQFNWGQYVGSLKTTSREFCIWLTKKRWVHRSELLEIIKGHIDGHDCKLSKTTGLPLGMIPDTNVDNFVILVGGYTCGHHYYMVPDSAVPDDVKRRHAATTTGLQSNFIETIKPKVEHNLSKKEYKHVKETTGLDHSQLVNLTGGVPAPEITNIKHSISLIESAGVLHSSIFSDQYKIMRQIHYNDKWIYNSLMKVFAKGKGIGLNLFLNQVKEARLQGFKRLDVTAEGNYTIRNDWNGYLTWAKFGYIMDKPSQLMFNNLMKENNRAEKSVFELVSTKEGQDFWEKNGKTWTGSFDLKDGSKAMNNLKEYLDQRKIKFEL